MASAFTVARENEENNSGGEEEGKERNRIQMVNN